jgi:D-threonine aldolase
MTKDAIAWYTINDINAIDSPALIIYKDRVKHNIALAIEMTGDVNRLRPHVKTHKSPQVTELMLQAGITKFKCATIAEAEMLGQCKAQDVLLAYQPTGPKTRRLISLMQTYKHTHFSCVVDSIDAAKAIAETSIAHDVVIDVFIDVNIGMNRTGIQPNKAMELYNTCKELDGIRLIGLHGYDGHINDTDITIRMQRADEAFGFLIQVKKQLIGAGLQQPVIVIGGSPTFPMHAAREDVECSPGTFVYWDWSYSDNFPDMGFQPAALVISRAVSVLNETTLCLDLGHKSIAAENPLQRRVYWLNAPELKPIGHSEEHMVVNVPLNHNLQIGYVLYGMPYHICPTCALYDKAFVIENGRIKESWQMTARDRMMSI